ncbi:hypothetical protein JHK82_033056 [Glycine max]|nr:hypothetical protein JHK82_033056 [Glycine max]
MAGESPSATKGFLPNAVHGRVNLTCYSSMDGSDFQNPVFSLQWSSLLKVEMPQIERSVTRSNSRAKTPPRTLPPPRGLVKIRVFKILLKSARAFTSLATTTTTTGDATSHTSPSTTPTSPTPNQ